MTPQPRSPCAPALWRYEAIRPRLMEAGTLEHWEEGNSSGRLTIGLAAVAPALPKIKGHSMERLSPLSSTNTR